MQKKKFYLRIGLILFGFIIIFGGISIAPIHKISLIIDKSHSLPYKFYIGLEDAKVQNGNYILLKHKKYPGLLIKKIGGIKGNKIEIRNSSIYVNNNFIGNILNKTMTNGEKLTPLSDHIIPENHFFVHGTHPESFDSRYEEFGLVSKDNIKRKLWPIF